jgi:hypothetical protein
MDAEQEISNFSAGVALGCALAYALFFFFNHLLFDRLEFTRGVNWVFLPSGLRLALVLVFLGTGSMGIALASCAINWFYYNDHLLGSVVVGIISGYAPWLARRFSIEWLGMDPDIRRLTPMQLLQIAIIFATCSAVLHQLWFAWNTPAMDFIENTAVMVMGDLLGTLIMLLALRLLVLWWRSARVNT